ncbi:hypothetical protein [Butyrivibrio sp. WCD3002]|uniref:hypothetical protein n=1 Tax=Butyrivibrio sp. WCD3002 TaxID=1280676 RepID=UPI0004253325|nr:hypothetical protein [Butyrivibrio sp. WCD3002]
MRKLSRFGAAALALALSVTFLTPVNALAAKNEYTEELNLNKDISDSGVVDNDKITIGDVTGTGTNSYDAQEDAKDKIVRALVARGLVTTTKPVCACKSRAIDGTVYYYSDYYHDKTDSSSSGGVYTYTYKGVYIYKYTNSQTKKTSIFRREVDSNYTGNEAKERTFQSAIRVKKGEITYLGVSLTGGDTAITSLKSSKKAIAKVSLYNKMSEDTTDTSKLHTDWEEITDPATNKISYVLYYYTTVGARVVVGTFENFSDLEKAMIQTETTASASATRFIKIEAKKPGNTNLTFSIKNKNGNTSKVSTKIYVVDDTRIFNKLTYAGQSLIDDKDLDKKSFYAYSSSTFYTTKAKGKLVAKANKNYVIKSIEVGTLYAEAYNEGMSGTNPDGTKYDHSGSYSAYSKTGKTTEHCIDLNGDGDFDDTINGMSERNVTYKYSKTKSGKTVRLSKVGKDYDSSYSSTKKYTNWWSDEYGSTSTTIKDRNFYAPTQIRITYYDKLLKQYGTSAYTIRLRVSK